MNLAILAAAAMLLAACATPYEPGDTFAAGDAWVEVLEHPGERCVRAGVPALLFPLGCTISRNGAAPIDQAAYACGGVAIPAGYEHLVLTSRWRAIYDHELEHAAGHEHHHFGWRFRGCD